MTKAGQFSAEVRERAERLVQEHEHVQPSRWAAVLTVAGKIGCSGETLRWVRLAEGFRDQPRLATKER